jgi:hypothetical protein
LTSPAAFSDQVSLVRSWRDAIYGDDQRRPKLWIDEWNLSAGGFDRRHDTAEGAAFQAAVIVELQRAGLNRASIFRSVDPAYGPDVVPESPELYGGWGLVGRRGTIKPAWRAHRFWGELGRDVLAFTGPQDARLGMSALLTRHNAERFVALAANFQASGAHAHRLEVRLEGAAAGRWVVRVLGVDGSQRSFTITSRGVLVAPVDVDPQSAVLIDLGVARRR